MEIAVGDIGKCWLIANTELGLHDGVTEMRLGMALVLWMMVCLGILGFSSGMVLVASPKKANRPLISCMSRGIRVCL